MTTHNRQTAASHKKLPTFYHHQQHVQYELHKLTLYNITLFYLYTITLNIPTLNGFVQHLKSFQEKLAIYTQCHCQ